MLQQPEHQGAQRQQGGVISSISLLCSFSLRQRWLRTRSTMTVKPIPPRMSRAGYGQADDGIVSSSR